MAKKAISRKNWYDLVAPSVFNSKVYGTTVAADEKLVKGRVTRLPLNLLTGTRDKYYMSISLKIDAVEGSKALSSINGLFSSKEYIGRMTRRGTNRIDVIEDFETKDKRKVRVKLVGVTIKKTDSSTIHAIRQKMIEVVKADVEGNDFDHMIKSVIQNAVQKKVLNHVKKIYPLRGLEVRRIDVLK